ncbi:subtilisin-like protein [Xylariomycetidae sp. FL0641]|nr:subtilisin-like protein [Xylariomycetidae sp. FL0641]
MSVRSFVLLGLAAVNAAAHAIAPRAVVHEKRSEISQAQWAKGDRLAGDEVLSMKIGLAQRNLERGHDFIMDVADPSSPNYGKHWTTEQIRHTFAPTKDTVDAVKDWMVAAGVPSSHIKHTSSQGWLAVELPVSEAEKLFQTQYHSYEHTGNGDQGVGCDEYKIPLDVKEHVDFVYPGTTLAEVARARQKSPRSMEKISSSRPAKKAPRQTSNDAADCVELATPQCIADLYEIPPADKAAANNSLGIFQRGSWYQMADLQSFLEQFAPNIPPTTRPLNVSIDLDEWHYNISGDPSQYQPGEADLDIEMALPIIYPQNVTVFQTDDDWYAYDTTHQGLFNTFLDAIDGSYCNYSAYNQTGDDPYYDATYPNTNDDEYYSTYDGERMCGVYKPTNVISISYGRGEYHLSDNYSKRQCDEFMKLGLQGISVVIASGDSGILQDRGCSASNLGNYGVQYPTNCPYVTAVGATMLLANGSEAAAKESNWASQGGFSNIYDAPSYQADATAAYLAANPAPFTVPAGGRGVPDVAALGVNVASISLGNVNQDGGTSAAAPLFAAMLNRVNEERLAAGKATVGFVNPVLYQNPAAFNDIVLGDNGMCGIVNGFAAAQGWDPVTGLGTPNYPKLLDVFMALP